MVSFLRIQKTDYLTTSAAKKLSKDCRPTIDVHKKSGRMKIFPKRPTYDEVCQLEDSLDGRSPHKVIEICRRRSCLATTMVFEDAWKHPGHLPILDLINMKHVQVEHVQEMHRLMKQRLPKELLRLACQQGCESDIILYIAQANPKSITRKGSDGHLPVFHLLGSCQGPEHLPALQELLRRSKLKKKQIPKYIQKFHTNPKCPQEFLDDLLAKGGGTC